MSRKVRNGGRRLMAFVLSMVLVIANIGANTGTVSAAEKKEEPKIALFMLDGREILDAIQDLDSQGSFELEDLELGSAQRSVKKVYEKLLAPEKGEVYELALAVDDRLAPEDTQLVALYRTATEDVVFLFVNESSEPCQFCVNIDGYETELVKVDPSGVYVEGEEEEAVGGIVSGGTGSSAPDGSGGVGGSSSGGSGNAGSSSSGGSGSTGSSGPAGDSAADRGGESISDSKGTTGHDRDDHTSSGDTAKDDDRTADNAADTGVSGGAADNVDSTGGADGTTSDKGGADKGDGDAGASDSGDSSDGAEDNASGDNSSSGAESDASSNSSPSGTGDSVSDGGSGSGSTGSDTTDGRSDSTSNSGSSSSSTGGGASDSGSGSEGGDSGSADSGSRELSISRHQTAFVAVPLEDIQSGDEAEGEVGQEEAKVEETTATEAEKEEEEATEAKKEDPEESSPVESESAPEGAEEAPTEESKEESGSEDQEGSSVGEGEGTPEDLKGTSPEESTEKDPEESAGENTEETAKEETTESGEEKEEETTASAETESAAAPADAETEEEADSKGGQTLDDGWEIPGKEYKSITIWKGASARAYLVELEEIEKVVAYNEALETLQVEYQVIPDGAAKIVGADTVKMGGTLYFAVEPEEGLQIISVTANGLTVEEVTDVAALKGAEDTGDADGEDLEDADLTCGGEKAAKDDEAESLAEWERYAHVYKVEAEDEDLVIEVGLDEELIPAKVYTAETDDAVFTVDVPDGAFAEEVGLKVSKIIDEAELKTYADQANGALAADKVVAEVRAYDLSFVSEETGEEVEPTETVSVSIQFKKAPVVKDMDEDQVTGLSVVHLPEDEDAKVMTSVDDVKETEMEFKTDSFSVYAVTLNTTAAASFGENGFATMQGAIDAAQDGDTIRLEKAIEENVKIEKKNLTIDLNGQTWKSKYNADTQGTASIITVSESTLTLVGNGKITGVDNNKGYRTITAKDTTLIIGKEDDGDGQGPVIEGNNSNFTMQEGVDKKKGGVILLEGGSLVMYSGTVTKGFLSNPDTYGGGIAVVGGDGFTMNGGVITANTTYAYGGGVSVENAPFIMAGGMISKNTIKVYSRNYPGNGAGVYVYNAAFTMDDGTIDGNVIQATNSINKGNFYGGGIYVNGGYNRGNQVKINGGSITKNTAIAVGNSQASVYGYGGGLCAVNCEVTIDKGTFSGNIAKSEGGAVYISSLMLLTAKDSVFRENTAGSRGGAIRSQGLILDHCEVIGNKLTKGTAEGGGVYDGSVGQNVTIGGGTSIKENVAANGKGGGVYIFKKKGEDVRFGDVTITQNTASQGGGVAIDTGTAALASAARPSVTITEETKVYENAAVGDREISGTSTHVSDEFLFFTVGGNVERIGFGSNEAPHTVMVGNVEYKLLDHTSLEGEATPLNLPKAIGYHIDQEAKIQKEECIDKGDVYLDPEEGAELYVWDDRTGRGEKLTTENGLCTTLKQAYEAAKDPNATGVIYVCSPVSIGGSDDPYLGDQAIQYKRYKTHTGYMFMVSPGETATLNGAQVDGGGFAVQNAMIKCGPGSVLKITGNTDLKNANNIGIENPGGAVDILFGALEMDAGTIQGNYAEGGGGGICVRGSGAKAVITGGTISENKADSDGGGILISDGAELRMIKGESEGRPQIIKNITKNLGGGICFKSSSNGHIENAYFEGNRMELSGIFAGGGGIHIYAGCTLKMENVHIYGNKVTGTVLPQCALYSCPTGDMAIFEVNGALVTGNGSPDIAFANGTNGPHYAHVSDRALGGGDNNWLKGAPNSSYPAPKPYYQNTKDSFTISSKVSTGTIALAKEEATVIMTKNEADLPGSAIGNNGTLIIGTETKSLEVVKKWEDEHGNELKEHPDQVMVMLVYWDKETGKWVVPDEETRKDARQILSEENGWYYCWEDLGLHGKWSVVEANMSGYVVEGNAATPVPVTDNPLLQKRERITLTNKKDDTADRGSLAVSKTVYGEKDGAVDADDPDRRKGFTFTVALTDIGDGYFAYRIVHADKTKGDLQFIEDAAHFEVTLEDGEAFAIEGLPKGTGYTITEIEGSRKDYAVYIDGELTDGTVTGTIDGKRPEVEVRYVNVETTSIHGSKTWEDDDDRDGVRPQKIGVTLTAVTSAGKNVTYTKEVTAEDGWAWDFDGLPKYDEQGMALDYRISEEMIPGYSPVYASASDAAGRYNITNRHTPGESSRTVEKIWIDGDDRDHIRPSSIKVQLYKTVDGVKEAQGDAVVLKAEDGWSYTWEHLFDMEGGNPITYSVEEVDIPEKYQVQVEENGSKFIMTNTYQPSVVSKTVEKHWDDVEDRDGLRPASVQARLLADGREAEVETPVVTLEASNGWKYTWTELPVNREGRAISYTVEEIQIPDGYTAHITYNGDQMLITNTHTPEEPRTPDNPGTPGRTKVHRDRDPGTPTTTIDPGPVPFAAPPQEDSAPLIPIDDESVPLFGMPRTGDRSVSTGALIGMMVVSLMAACGIYIKKHKEGSYDKKEE